MLNESDYTVRLCNYVNFAREKDPFSIVINGDYKGGLT